MRSLLTLIQQLLSRGMTLPEVATMMQLSIDDVTRMIESDQNT